MIRNRTVMLGVIVIACLFMCGSGISFTLYRNREYCFNIGEGQYDIQYTVSGQQQQNVRCTITDNYGTVLSETERQSQKQIEINVGSGASICFSGLDNRQKTVSFDILEKRNIVNEKITENQYAEIFRQLEKLHFNVQKLYGHQHFYIDRNRIHRQKLYKIHNKLKFVLTSKAILIAVCALVQYLVIRKILDRKKRSYSPINLG